METFNIVFWHALSFVTMTLKLKFRSLIYFLDQFTNGHYELYKSVYIKGLLFLFCFPVYIYDGIFVRDEKNTSFPSALESFFYQFNV